MDKNEDAQEEKQINYSLNKLYNMFIAIRVDG